MATRLISKTIFATLILNGCVIAQKQSDFAPKLYVGRSTKVALFRKQSGAVISCTDPVFDDYIAMHKSDWDCLIKHYKAKGTTNYPECDAGDEVFK